ncbi:MAG: YybS family protein [Firmicutes bacterium]|nr:YybS family protein [Bacillota bacterium]
MANHTSARPLVEGALLAAVTAVLALIGYAVPLVPLFLPVPIVLIGMRHGLRLSLLTVIVVGLVLAVTLGPSTALLETIAFGSAGLAIGFGVHRQWPVTWTLVLTAAASAVATFLALALTFYLMGINQVSEMARAMAQAVSMTKALLARYPQFATPQAQTQMAQLELAPDLIRRIWWAVLMAAGAFSAVLQYAVVRWTLRYMRIDLPPVPSFATWRAPSEGVWILALGLVAQLFGPPQLRSLGEGLYAIMMYLYLTDGTALTYALLRRYHLSRGAGGILAVLLGLSLGPVVVIAGLVDSLLDFRLWLEAQD